MIRRSFCIALLLGVAVSISGCRHNHAQNPIANVDSKQPDKVLFDRSIDALKKGKYDTARITLQTLIYTYPDSEYIARAKLAIGDSWYEEGTSAGLQQAEAEYKDFQTFFPNLPEAAEAQMKVANIHYRQMEKPDRDFTHAKRAEDEYRQMIQQYPDSKLLPEAKQHLREVQEVLAEREFRIGHFYYLRESWPAAIARLKSLTDTYPLYSQADDALMMLADAYERDAQMVKNTRIPEAAKAKLLQEYMDGAAAAYQRVITRYPAQDRVNDARARLKAMNRTIPTATPEAVAQNKAELQGREELGRFGRIMLNLHKRPDTAMAAKTGEPTLVDPQSTDAPSIVKNVINTTMNPGEGKNSVSVEKAGAGAPGENQPVPRSDNTTDAASSAPGAMNGNNSSGGSGTPAQSETGIEELKVTPAQTPGQPPANPPANSVGSPATQPAPTTPQSGAPALPSSPAQVNDAQASGASSGSSGAAATNGNNSSPPDASNDSSSKKKKKKRFF